jgi:hypothetical protein
MDEQCEAELTQTIYKCDDDYFLDEDLTTLLQIQSMEPDTAPDDALRPGVHETWTKHEALFLIDAMRRFITDDSDNLPKSLSELEAKVRSGRGKQKSMWAEIAARLTEAFKLQFDPKRVSRKWQTLFDGFKKCSDNNNSTGRSTCKFAFMTEMTDLLGDRHDINFVATATAAGVKVHRDPMNCMRMLQSQRRWKTLPILHHQLSSNHQPALAPRTRGRVARDVVNHMMRMPSFSI